MITPGGVPLSQATAPKGHCTLNSDNPSPVA